MVIHRLRRLLSFVRSRLPAYVFVWLVASSLLFTGASAIAQPQGGPPGGNPTGGGPPSEPPGLVRIGDILGDRSIDWNNPQQRARAVRRIREIEESQFQKARDIARQRGIPERQEFPDGTVIQLVGLDDEGEPFFHQTYNANAAISTGADILRASPYNLDGSGLTVGVWDGGEVRTTHQEFVGRVTLKNTGSLSDHATHVAGTIAAAGVVSAAKGMAPAIHVDSYYFSNIINEMNATGASAPDQFETKIYVSNHSYGPANMGWSGNRWYGTGTDNNAYNASFGRYDGTSSTVDGTAFNQPYHMMVYAAGNERNDNPSVNQQVTFDGENFFPYDPAIHPPGDGVYRNGFDNLGSYAVAKNTLTVGAVNDAVTDGLRDPSKATMSHFSSWGPADDGRIKPDVVGNGKGVYSPTVPQSGATDQSYGNKQGTSMAAPNVSGSAALLVQLYRNLFGQHAAMRASTLKGLLIHTATDLGTPGPNYSFGWGLVNVHKAAELIVDHHTDPSKERIREHFLSTSVPARSYEFEWDGSSPIRATLSWTDPAGTSTSGHDDRTSKLVNDLDLKIIAPNGDEYLPFVMPFVSLGDWNVENMSLPATTGTNSTDNVEQVFIENPGQAGTWQIEITHKGSLTNGEQVYSLLLSGMAGDPDLLVLQSITPDNGDIGTVVTVDIIGNALSEHTTIVLRRDGQPDISGVFVEMIGNTLRCNFNLSSVAWGAWDVVATNPDEQTFTLTQGFSVNPFIMVLFEEDFEASSSLPAGWSQEELVGTGASWKVQTGGRTGESSPLTAYSGSRNVTLFMSNYGDNIVRLHTPTLDLSGHADVVLQFQHHMEYWDPDQDELHIYYSANGGSSWSLLAEYTTSVTPWTLQEIMLPSPSANYVIAFEGNAKWGSGVCIDDVQILAYGEPEPTPATLSVTPAVGLSSSGVAGGPFDPASRVYTLTNAGSDPLDWEASKTEGWVSLSTSSGVLEPGASTTVTVSINSAADSLDVDTYSDTVNFTNTTNGEGNDTRAVSLSVLGPGTLVVTPEEDYTASGVEGGPFSPASKVYTLTNPGGEAIDWTVGKTATWLALSATSGTLAAEASTTVTVSIHSDADELPFAVYEDTITFVNTTNGNGNDTRDVTLTATEMVPDVPSGLTATSHIGRVDLVWEPAARAASYNVKRANVSSGPYTTIASQAESTYSDFSATDVQAYFYVVSAVNSGGESANSDEAVAFVRHILPFEEDFDALVSGDLSGQNGWEALDAVVQADVSMSGQAAMITSEEGYVSQTFAGNETNVWTDFYVQPIFFDGEPGTPDADATTVLSFNEDGNPMVYDGPVLRTFGEVSIATGAWVRVTVRSDYVAKTWDLYIDTDLIAEDLGFYDATAQYYTEFRIQGAGSGTVAIDDILIDLDSPFALPVPFFAVLYDGNENSGGAVPVDVNSPYPAAAEVTVLDNTNDLVKTGHFFGGWNTQADGEGTAYNPGNTFNISSNTTLYAQWEINTYTVTFVTDGTAAASLDGDTTQEVAHGADTSPVTAVAPSGHNFVNWTLADVEYTTDTAVTVTNVIDSVELVANFAAKATIEITAASAGKIYDGTPLTANDFSVAGALQTGHTVVSVEVTGSQTVVGSSANVAANAVIQDEGSQDVTDTYIITYEDGTLTVTPATLTVTADGKSVTYGDAVPELTYQITGFVSGDTEDVVTGDPDLATDYTAGTPVVDSPVAITVELGDLAAANYTFVLVDGALAITPAAPTVTEWPRASEIVTGQTLGRSELMGGSAEGVLSEPLGNAFSFVADTGTVVSGAADYEVEFVPNDALNYITVIEEVPVPARAPTETTAGERETRLSWFDQFDLMPADAEVETFEDLLDVDSDGNGMTNWEEYIAGTDPTDPDSTFRLLGVIFDGEGNVTVNWFGGTNGPVQPYIVKTLDSLAGETLQWEALENEGPRMQGTNTWQGQLEGTMRFFRILATPDE